MLIRNLGEHLSESNEDTRFVVAPAMPGLLGVLASVGEVRSTSAEPSLDRAGSGIVLDRCFALTGFHVVEGREIISSDVQPLRDRRVRFSYRSRRDGRAISASARVMDPGILKLGDRKWADDIVLLRFEAPQADEDIRPARLGDIIGQTLKTARDFDVGEQVFIASGYPAGGSSGHLLADICTPKAVARNFGVLSNCVLTPGMSGGPIVWLRRSGDSYDARVVGIITQPASDYGLFSKGSESRSAFAALTPSMLAALSASTAGVDLGTCRPR